MFRRAVRSGKNPQVAHVLTAVAPNEKGEIPEAKEGGLPWRSVWSRRFLIAVVMLHSCVATSIKTDAREKARLDVRALSSLIDMYLDQAGSTEPAVTWETLITPDQDGHQWLEG